MKYKFLLVFILFKLTSLNAQIKTDLICLSEITDSIRKCNNSDLFLLKVNDSLLTKGQDYCVQRDLIKSINFYKSNPADLNDTLIVKIGIDINIKKVPPTSYLYVDKMPVFKEGNTDIMQFIFENFKYPSEIDACCKIFVSFIITESGQLSELKILRGLQEDFDNEIIRVFSIMPSWEPGFLNGKPVPVKMYLPINVSLR